MAHNLRYCKTVILSKTILFEGGWFSIPFTWVARTITDAEVKTEMSIAKQEIFLKLNLNRNTMKTWSICYKLIQRFRVTGLFAGQHNTELHGTITDLIYTIVGSALLRD